MKATKLFRVVSNYETFGFFSSNHRVAQVIRRLIEINDFPEIRVDTFTVEGFLECLKEFPDFVLTGSDVRELEDCSYSIPSYLEEEEEKRVLSFKKLQADYNRKERKDPFEFFEEEECGQTEDGRYEEQEEEDNG